MVHKQAWIIKNYRYDSYKERMGKSEGIDMQFNLQVLLNRVQGLDELTVPFEEKEMDDVIMSMPNDRSPGQMVSMAYL
jgi:hypothetical protein